MDEINRNRPNNAAEPDRLSPESQSHEASPSQYEEENIPWAEIIVEPEPTQYSESEENLIIREDHSAETTLRSGFLSRIYDTLAGDYAHGPLGGPPLAVLIVILIAVILWMST